MGNREATPYQRVVGALKARGSRRSGSNWQCPAHDDREPSLSVNEGKTADGLPTVLINCFAGCNTIGEVLPALDLDARDLFVEQLQPVLFNAERFSPVRRAGWLALPPSPGRDFGLATTFGRFVREDGTRGYAWSRHGIIAIVHDRKARAAFITASKMSPGQYRWLVRRWKALGMAHRCDQNLLCLFIKPETRCPHCGQSVSEDTNVDAQSVSEDTNLSDEALVRTPTSRHEPVPTKTGSHKRLGKEPSPDLGMRKAKDASTYDGVKALQYLAEDERRRGGK